MCARQQHFGVLAGMVAGKMKPPIRRWRNACLMGGMVARWLYLIIYRYYFMLHLFFSLST